MATSATSTSQINNKKSFLFNKLHNHLVSVRTDWFEAVKSKLLTARLHPLMRSFNVIGQKCGDENKKAKKYDAILSYFGSVKQYIWCV